MAEIEFTGKEVLWGNKRIPDNGRVSMGLKMKKMKRGVEEMKRILAVLLCVVLLMSMGLTGCGAAKENGGTTASTGAQGTGTQAVETAGPPEELTIATYDNWYAPASYAQNLPIYKEMEKKLNIKLVWNVKPISEYMTALDLKFASGQDLEDIMVHTSMDFNKFKNLVTPMNELIEKNGPNIKAFLDQRPDVKAFMTLPDGAIYSLPIVLNTENSPFGSFFMRQDWLDKCGLKMPETTDEFYNVMMTLREKDPNGNGKKDEVYAIHSDAIIGSYFAFFGGSFGIHPVQQYYSVNANGDVEFDFLTPRGKEYLAYMNKLYKAGILDPQIIGMNFDSLTARFGANQVAAIHWYNWGHTWLNSQVQKTDANVNFQCTLLKGPDGSQMIEAYPQASTDTFISKDCKKPEVAMKFLDFLWSEEGRRMTTFGIEGDTYTMVDGKPVFTDKVLKNAEGLTADDVLRSMGALPNITNIQDYASIIEQTKPAVVKDAVEKTKSAIRLFDLFMVARPTAEESAALNNNDLTTYMNEMIVKFVTGAEPIDNYDQFGTKLKELGVEKIIAAKKSMNDRAKSLNK